MVYRFVFFLFCPQIRRAWTKDNQNKDVYVQDLSIRCINLCEKMLLKVLRNISEFSYCCFNFCHVRCLPSSAVMLLESAEESIQESTGNND